MSDISQYSGKCDFGDTWEIFGEERILKADIYLGRNIVPLRIDSYKDALPYFPYLESVIASDEKHMFIKLSEESYVDTEEREILQWHLDELVRYYRKCRRKKKEYKTEEAVQILPFTGVVSPYMEILAQEVKEHGEKAEIPTYCHTPSADYYRKQLCEDMIKAGYTEMQAKEWCYGWERIYHGD